MKNLNVGVLFPWADKAWINECSSSEMPGSMVIEINGAFRQQLVKLVFEDEGKTFAIWYADVNDKAMAEYHPISCFVLASDDEHGVKLVPVRGSIMFAVKRKAGSSEYRDITQAELKRINSMHLGSTILREKEIRASHLEAKTEWLREKQKSAPDLQLYEEYQFYQNLVNQYEEILRKEAA